jgi:hypothetical protein
LVRWTLAEPEWLGTASGVRAVSIAGVNSERRDYINMHGSPWCPRPPVGGHPAMVVAIEVQRGRAQERGAWEGGVKGARLLFRSVCLVALFSLLLASLSCAGFV